MITKPCNNRPEIHVLSEKKKKKSYTQQYPILKKEKAHYTHNSRAAPFDDISIFVVKSRTGLFYIIVFQSCCDDVEKRKKITFHF